MPFGGDDGERFRPRHRVPRPAVRLVLAVVAVLSMLFPPVALAQDDPAALDGAFAVTIADEDVPLDLVDRATVVGRWEIAFDGGQYALSRQDVGELARGRFRTAGDTLMLDDHAGILACPPSAGSYRWRVEDGRLFLAAVEEPCAPRRLILTTRVLVAAVPCPPASDGSPSPVPGAPPEPIAATPQPAGATAATPTPIDDIEAAIDDLLVRMSACWATRDPERFLALTSDAYRAAIRDGGADGYRRFAVAMALPLVWDRVEPVTLTDARHATAVVRQTSGDHQDYGRYAFVFEDGAWRWDGVFGEA